MPSSMFTRLRALVHHLNHAKMSTVHNTNVACCTIPPVKSDYTPKGTFKSYAGFSKVSDRADLPKLMIRMPMIIFNRST